MNRILKKTLIWCLLLALLLPVLASAVPVACAEGGFSEMYVKTSNGKSLTVRAEPSKKAKSVGKVQYRQLVYWDWSYAGNDGWSKIAFGANNYGFVQSRYLVSDDPGPYHKPTKAPTRKPTRAPATPKPTRDPKKEAEETRKQQAELDRELRSEKEVGPFYIQVRPQRSTGWVNFRVGPSTITSKITSYPSGKELIAEGETRTWWRARDPETNRVGYIFKNLTVRMNEQAIAAETASGVQKLGRLSVNGEFELTCKLPADYKLQVVDLRGESIIASVTSDDMTKPQMYLSIAYDDLYGEVERMNDLSEDDLAVLEGSYTSEYQVEIEYRQTGYGTKLMMVKEVGNKESFVDFLSIYKGYLVEFNLTPSPHLADQTLTAEQIRMCIDFLTDVNFVPVKK